MKTLTETIDRILDGPQANGNNLGLTFSAEYGWGITYTPSDMQEGEVLVINRDSMEEWLSAPNEGWSAMERWCLEDWIRTNAGTWLDDSGIPADTIRKHLC